MEMKKFYILECCGLTETTRYTCQVSRISDDEV